MTGSVQEGGEGAVGGAGKAKEKAKAKAEQGLRLFNTEGRTKQLFRPHDRRQGFKAGVLLLVLVWFWLHSGWLCRSKSVSALKKCARLDVVGH